MDIVRPAMKHKGEVPGRGLKKQANAICRGGALNAAG